MGKKRRILLAVLVVAVLGGLAWLMQRRSEPVYHGKPFSYWLKDLEHWDKNTNNAALVAFHDMGTNAIPSLLDVLQSRRGLTEQTLMKLDMHQSSIFRHLYEDPWEKKMAASWALYAIGSNALPALPVLTNMLFDSNETAPGAIALAGIGSDGIPFLLAALTNQNHWVIRCAAAESLGWERSDLESVVPALIERLHDPHQYVRYSVATSLGQLHTQPEIVVPALMNDFSGNDTLLRAKVLDALGQFGSQARAAIPMVVEALKDQNVSYNAAIAFKKIDPKAAAKAGVK